MLNNFATSAPTSVSKCISLKIFSAKTARVRRRDFGRGGLVWDLLRGGGGGAGARLLVGLV